MDTISGCLGGEDCPLVKAPSANYQLLTAASGSKAPDVTQCLTPDLLCTFSPPVMQLMTALSRAPRGGGVVDLSSAAIPDPSGVVKAGISGLCSWDDVGLELAGRVGATSGADALAKLNACLSLMKNMAEKAGPSTQAAMQSGVGYMTFLWGKCGAHLKAIEAGTVRVLAKSASSLSSAELSTKLERPGSESKFFHILFMWVTVMCTLGHSIFLLSRFIKQTVFHTITVLGEGGWKTAHELILV